jgi:glycerol kinase
LILRVDARATRAPPGARDVESIAYQVRDVLDAMEADSGAPLSAL